LSGAWIKVVGLLGLLQLGALEAAGPAAAPEHLHWERAINLPAGASGQACAVLDANVFAHAAGRSTNDLRLFAGNVETPFALSESEPEAADVQHAPVENLGMRGGDVVFDLAMPTRAYTEVALKLAAANFVATAKVSGSDGHGGAATELGTFTLFDLSRQGLSRSTTLPLQESTFAVLHVALHVTGIDGGAYPGLSASMVEGADVPPSREAQTLYTVVAATSAIVQKDSQSIATFTVPAHVPVERVSFALDPTFTHDFFRTVTVDARVADVAGDNEHVEGEIWRVTRAGRTPAIDKSQMGFAAEIGSNLRDPATITVAVKNGNDAPLPITAVQLAMRQRSVCFDATPEAVYILRYGDATLHAPVYDYARLFQPAAAPVPAALGAERENPQYRARADVRPFSERHPELLWIALLLVVAVLGGTALHSVKRRT
jgi:hypothetical protein